MKCSQRGQVYLSLTFTWRTLETRTHTDDFEFPCTLFCVVTLRYCKVNSPSALAHSSEQACASLCTPFHARPCGSRSKPQLDRLCSVRQQLKRGRCRQTPIRQAQAQITSGLLKRSFMQYAMRVRGSALKQHKRLAGNSSCAGLPVFPKLSDSCELPSEAVFHLPKQGRNEFTTCDL